MKPVALAAALTLTVFASPARPDPVISADGRVVTFTFLANVYRYDRYSRELTRLNPCPEEILEPFLRDAVMTPDARFTAYTHDSNVTGTPSLCLRDEDTDETESIAGDLTFNPSLSADGRFFAYEQSNTAFQEVLLLDRSTRSTVTVSVDSQGNIGEAPPGGDVDAASSSSAAISGNGRFVAFISNAVNFAPNDTNAVNDTFVRDVVAGTTTRVSQSSRGEPANARSGFGTAISPDGRFVAFESLASNLVAGDTNGVFDIFVHDRTTGVTQRVSVSSTRRQANGESLAPQFSPDGRFIVFRSAASNLVPNDTNGVNDIFMHDLRTGRTQRVSLGVWREQANGASEAAALSAGGRFVVFRSAATNLVPRSDVPLSGVYMRDTLRGITEAIPAPEAP